MGLANVLSLTGPGAKMPDEPGDGMHSVSGPGSGEHRVTRGDAPAATISEKTRVSLQVGGIVAILLVGKYWGSWETNAENTATTLGRHEQSIAKLETNFANMERLLIQIQGEQNSSKETLTTAARNSTALLYEMGNIKVALAQKGIIVKGD